MQTRSTNKADIWREHIERWQSSGISQRAYCEQHNLKCHVFTYWKRKYGEQSDIHTSSFIPVLATPETQPLGLCVTLPNGVRVEGMTSLDQITSLLQALL